MTDRSTDNPEDQPVPIYPDQEPSEPNELAESAEPNRLTGEVDIDDLEEAGEPGGEAAADLDAEELEAAATAAEADERADTRAVDADVQDVDRRAVPAGAAARAAAKAPTSARAGGRTALEVDPALRIRDRASEVFVALTVVVFVAIFANAMLFGVGGAATRTPAPSPIASPVSSGSPAPSGSAAPSTSPAPTTTAAPSAS